MKKYIIFLCTCVVLFLPMYTIGDPGKCIKGDCFNGEGTFSWPDGKKYVGGWKEGKRTGQGTSTWADGAQYTGIYQDARKHGPGTFIWPNGAKYVGNFQNDKQHGKETLAGRMEKCMQVNRRMTFPTEKEPFLLLTAYTLVISLTETQTVRERWPLLTE